jgi:tetratricopeptide (TPR) repeat protein
MNAHPSGIRYAKIMRFLALVPALLCVATATAQQLDTRLLMEKQQVEALQQAFDRGLYQRCADFCRYGVQQGMKSPEVPMFLVRSLLALGQADDAMAAAADMVKAHSDHLPILGLHHEVLASLGKKAEAGAALKAINDTARRKPAKDRTSADMVALGRAALAAGADPQKVLEQYLSPAKKKDLKSELPYLAIGELALKHADYTKAANEFRTGLKEHGESPALRFGLAQAFAPGDRGKSLEHLATVLETNDHHEGALTLQAEHHIGAEKFAEAEASLATAIEVNPHSSSAWALRAVIATLHENDPAKASTARAEALHLWPQNPQVDHLIGQCLSRAYRFSEGAQQQREVLALDPEFLPAKLQLAHDLMRLGQTEEAWQLAAEIREADGYNTQAHNLGLLEREMSGYHVEKRDDFILRMPLRDWQVYGPRALQLLREAKTVLAPKYGHTFAKATMVEFFPSQQDFAIRTFGALGGQGLLGVCFGTVITMNSPGSLAHGRSNWESTLWHEFCHVVTLSATHNRMPRWLSEGISVYEERQRDPAWGMKMNATFRELTLGEETLTPLGQMSSAFLNAKDQDAILFAYYESSIAVEWIIQQHGWDKFRALLQSLATGDRINTALEKNIAPLEQLEPAFRDHMIALAKAHAPKADWSKPEINDVAALPTFLQIHPDNLKALHLHGSELLAEKQWEKAAETGQKLIDLNPEDTSAEGGYWLKARALHQLKRVDEEAALLRVMANLSGDVLPVYLRLIEIDRERQSWPELQTDAARALALNPFLPAPNEALAQAAQATGDAPTAIQIYQRLLHLSPANPAKVRYELASLLKPTNQAQAKRHLLDALAMAPRYQEAQKLLLDMQ